MKVAFPTTQNGIKCPDCGDSIFSNSHHDFVSCRCGRSFVDGGFDYFRGSMEPNTTRILTGYPKSPYFRKKARTA